MKLALVGHPVAHSLSPGIHQAALAECGIAGSYEAIEVEAEQLVITLERLFHEEYTGLNVTAPYKRAVLASCKSSSQLVQRLQSANTLIANTDGWQAETTDGVGIAIALHSFVHSSGQTAFVLGAGGFAAVVVAVLHSLNWRVRLCARSVEHADLICRQYADGVIEYVSWEQRQAIAERSNLIVNATSLGSDGVDSPLPFSIGRGVTECYLDAIYAPRETPLLSHYRGLGVQVQNGMTILLGQAASSFRLWTGVELPLAWWLQWEKRL